MGRQDGLVQRKRRTAQRPNFWNRVRMCRERTLHCPGSWMLLRKDLAGFVFQPQSLLLHRWIEGVQVECNGKQFFQCYNSCSRVPERQFFSSPLGTRPGANTGETEPNSPAYLTIF